MKKIIFFFLIAFFFNNSLVGFAEEAGSAVNSASGNAEKTITDPGMINAVKTKGENARVEKGTQIREQVDSLDLTNENIDSALDKISEMTGISFIVPQTFTGKVTLSIQDVSLNDLLNIILTEQGLAYYRTNGAAHIMTAQVYQQRYGQSCSYPYSVQVIPVKYANPENLITLLNVIKSPEGRIWMDSKNKKAIMIENEEKIKELKSLVEQQDIPLVTEKITLRFIAYNDFKEDLHSLLTENIGKIEPDETGKGFTVTDSEAKLQMIRDLVASKDKEVFIPCRLKIVRMDLNEEHLQGVDWEAIVSDFQAYELQLMSEEKPASEKISLGTITTEDYDVLIEALDTVGNLSHLVSFDVDLSLNEDNTVDLETNDPFWSLRPGAKEGQETPVVLDPEGFEMRINVKARKEGGKVYVEILPRLHWMQGEDTPSPILIGIGRARIELDNDEVIVMGGLIREEEIARTRKVPLLGDLPMLGVVFRRERRKIENTEYIIFIQPKSTLTAAGTK
ncbi:MAG: hypothetical protein AB1650_06320 [Candidatus Omnitrophota bacterium]